MEKMKKFSKRVVSILLTLVLLMTLIPSSAFSVTATGVDTPTADPSTMDGWKNVFPTGSTENAGAVWMDKSVLTDAAAFSGTGITKDGRDSFLVALSTMASNIAVTGMSHVPTDTLLVLDVSGSMNAGNNNVAEALVTAANESIVALLGTNKYNRVGVVLYSSDAVLMLPLGRYTTATDGKYLNYDSKYSFFFGMTETISIDPDVRLEGTNTRPAAMEQTVEGATYIQKGLMLAADQFTANGNSTTVEDGAMGTLNRKPVMVLMSDGAPTYSSTNFTEPGNYNLGNGQSSSTGAAQGFVTQLSAAYAKSRIEAKYNSTCLFYTLGLGVSGNEIATSVLDPVNSNTGINEFWSEYNALKVDDTLAVQGSGNNARTVKKIAASLKQAYVEQGNYFAVDAGSSDLSQGLKDAFADIVGTIQLQSKYYPTLISESEELSGYVSFVDKIGEGMEVTDIKGVLIHNTLFSGADMASNCVTGGGDLGTVDNPLPLGTEMVHAVQQRLGIADVDTARTLIAEAYAYGQLSYTDATEYSNYIGWYANKNGEFLGFYQDGVTELTPTADDATNPVFTVKSYGYLGEVDAEHGVSESDMMYATVQVRKNILTDEELVTFAVPAALIPLITYEVTLDENGAPSDLKAVGAEHPIRLVYEVALKQDINSFTLKEKLSSEYLADMHHVNTDGSVNFYTNRWDHQNTTGYGTVNTYSYFNPSRQNEKYYYTEDAPVYADAEGTLYTGAAQPSGVKYRAYKVYKKSGSVTTTETVYRRLSDAALATAVRNTGDNGWHVPKGNVHINLDGYTVYKGGYASYAADQNKTETLDGAFIPFVDTTNHSVNDAGYNFYVGATLGNNGKMSLTPETGIKLTKTMADGVAAPNKAFNFHLVNTTDGADNTTYPAYLVKADGTTDNTVTVKFSGGHADVSLYAGEALYIGGMTVDDVIRVVEQEDPDYSVQSVNGSTTLKAAEITVKAYELGAAAFVNTVRGKGNLTIAKEVNHDFGVDYQIPADKKFTMTVTLRGIGMANATLKAQQTNSTLTEIATDVNGSFTVTLAHNEKLEIFDLPEGVVATVVEPAPGAGFAPVYYDSGVIGDGEVTIVKDNTVSVIVVNDYTAAGVDPVNLTVGGTKHLTNEDGSAVVNWGSAEFTVELQRYNGTAWVKVDDAVVNSTNRTFNFDLSNERYQTAGTYSYQVLEVVPDTKIDGMFYDPVLHTFTVTVTDADMDGRLEIVRVHSDHVDKDFTQVDGTWNVQVDFNNVQYTTAPAVAQINIRKLLNNVSGSTAITPAGHRFGIYTDENCTTLLTDAVQGVDAVDMPLTDAAGEGRLEITFDETGTYTFWVKEIPGNNPYVTYTDKVVKATVVVANGVGGRLGATVTYDTATNAEGELEYTNTYTPAAAQLTIDFVSKILNGRAMAANEFTFELRDADGNKLLDGTNAAAAAGAKAAVTFNGVLTFDKVGITNYTIVETSASANGVTVDKTTYRMMVEVHDVSGQLTATYSLVNVAGDEAVFTNHYTATPVDHAIGGEKVLNGRVLLNDEFTFVLTEAADANGTVNAGAKTWTTTNKRDKTFTFAPITYTAAGTYYYTVSEEIKTGATFGIKYDEDVFVATVKIRDNGRGALEVESVTYKIKGGSSVSDITFVNDYVPASVKNVIPGDKALTGKVLGGGDFSFELYASDETWTQGAWIETVTNDANGNFAFAEIEYSKADTYYYLVKEVGGGTTVGGITYDDTVFRVRITVTDDLLGYLHASAVVFDQNSIPQAGVAFENVYAVTGNAGATVKGDKTLVNKTLTDNAFSFELYETAADLVINAAALQTVPNVGGGFKFDITYAPEDIGTHYYLIKEQIPAGAVDNKLNGYTYDSAVYAAVVTVKDNGDGTMSAEQPVYYRVVNNALSAAPISGIEFVNTYDASARDEIVLSATKTKNGAAVTTEKFFFELYSGKLEANGSISTLTKLQTKENNGERIVFDKLTYTSVQTVGTHYYVIKEQIPAGAVNNKLGGYTYDTAAYVAVVTVEDNGDGTLKVTGPTYYALDANDKPAATATPLVTFNNKYDAAAAKGLILSAKKTQEGKPLTTEKFTFELYEGIYQGASGVVTVGNLLQSKQNNGESILFDEIAYPSLASVGTHYYVIKEKIPAAAVANKLDGYTYDDAWYIVKAEVTDNGDGTLAVSDPIYYVPSAVGKPETAVSVVSFVNKYEAAAKNGLVITAKKTQIGKPLTSEVFTFELYNATVDAATSKVTVGTLIEAKQNVGGAITFGEIAYPTLDTVGTHYYVVKESIPAGAVENTLNGYTYDTTMYLIETTVSDNGDGTLKVEAPMRYVINTEGRPSVAATEITFENKYAASADKGVVITAEKLLEGKTLTTELFNFDLYLATLEADGTVKLGNLLQSKQNNGAAIAFDEITYPTVDTVGTHYYVVKESIPSEAVNNTLGTITYDTAAYVAVVTVEDNGDGTLKVSDPSYYAIGEDGKPLDQTAEKVTFTNTHTPASITVDIVGTKFLKKDGTEVALDGKEFVFELYEVQGTEEIKLATVKNAADGSITFADLPADKAGVYTYLVKEAASPYDEISSDTTVYTVTVTVADENGTLVATKVITANNEAVEKITFVNEYKPVVEPEKPEQPDEPTPPAEPEPETGVKGNLNLLFVLMFVSGAASAAAVFGKKRKTQE